MRIVLCELLTAHNRTFQLYYTLHNLFIQRIVFELNLSIGKQRLLIISLFVYSYVAIIDSIIMY